jgi:hypothetical protein
LLSSIGLSGYSDIGLSVVVFEQGGLEVAVPRPPAGCSNRARAWWRAMHADGRTITALEQALMVEAVRLMSRADQLAEELAAVQGGAAGREERRPLLVEARLTATALKGVVAELRQHNAGGRALAGGNASGGAEVVETPKVVSLVDQLSARRTQRRADAAGGVVPGGEE